MEGGVVGLEGESGFVAGGVSIEYGGGRGCKDEHVITKDAEREDGQGEGVTGTDGVAIEEAGEGFVVVFWTRMSLLLDSRHGQCVPWRATVLEIVMSISCLEQSTLLWEKILLPECWVENNGEGGH